jgi:hypothetical protein
MNDVTKSRRPQWPNRVSPFAAYDKRTHYATQPTTRANWEAKSVKSGTSHDRHAGLLTRLTREYQSLPKSEKDGRPDRGRRTGQNALSLFFRRSVMKPRHEEWLEAGRGSGCAPSKGSPAMTPR